MTDPYEHDDAAYVLGALSPLERADFEAHLRGCAGCSARVAEIADVPDLLEGMGEADVVDSDPLPDTVLPALLRTAAARRRRTRALVAGFAALAAACAIALVVVLWPGRPAQPPARQPFVAVAQSPVRASATLTATSWGTAIDVHCHYAPGVDRSFTYGLVVYSRSGGRFAAGDWTLPADKDVNYATGTSLPVARIARIDITLPDGTPVLRLRP